MGEMRIDGELYVDGRRAAALLQGLVTTDTIRELGLRWRRKKIGNRWYYRKSDLALPHYPPAKWQRLVLMFLILYARQHEDEALEQKTGEVIGRDDYYIAAAFLKGARYEMLTTGRLGTTSDHSAPVYVLGYISEDANPLLIIMDDQTLGGRFLTAEEHADCYRSNGVEAYWDVGPVALVVLAERNGGL